MKDRLQQFLDIKNISAARLADMMGIQRSALSHILGGRNKPSYDFISKFITLFPYVNAEWFITGKGEAFKNMASSGTLPATPSPAPSPSTAPAPATAPATVTTAPAPTAAAAVQIETQENDDDFPIAVKEEMEENSPKEHRINRIIILFSDGTYQEMK